MEYIAEIQELKHDHTEFYDLLEQKIGTVGAAVVEVDRTDCSPSVIYDQLKYNSDQISLLERHPRADLDEVSETMRALEKIGAISEYRSFGRPRFTTSYYDSEEHSLVQESLHDAERVPSIPEIEENRPLQTELSDHGDRRHQRR